MNDKPYSQTWWTLRQEPYEISSPEIHVVYYDVQNPLKVPVPADNASVYEEPDVHQIVNDAIP